MSDDRPLPFVRGALGGIGAFAVGYVVTYLWYAGRVRDSLFVRTIAFATGRDVTREVVGWLFYNAHFVTVETEGLLGRGGSQVNPVSQTDLFSTFLYAVPVLLLLVAGAAVARWTSLDSYGETVVAGASVAFGYLPAAALGVLLVRVAFQGVLLGPDFPAALVVAGIAYPVAFGAIGAVLYWQYEQR